MGEHRQHAQEHLRQVDVAALKLLPVGKEKQDHHLILIAHNPLLSRLFSLLVDGTTEGARQVETSNALCIMMDIIAPGCGELKYVLSHD